MKLEAATRYVEGTILPAMGIQGRAFTISPPPEGGTRSSLFLTRIEGMPPLLLRAFQHRRQAVRNAEALRHLDQLELPAPRLVFHDLSRRSRLLPAAEGPLPYVTVETWIEGTRHASIVDPDLAGSTALEVAALLARFHGATRAGWGRPGSELRGRLRSFVSYTMSGSRRIADSLASTGWLGRDEARTVISRFASWREVVGRLDTFNLVHNDANRHNFVVTASGDVVPVDLHRLAYEPFVEEVVNALYHFCRKDTELAERFLAAYFARSSERSREIFETTRGFFEPLNYLKKMYRRGTQPPGGRLERSDPKMARWKEIVLAMGEGPRWPSR